jgi:hypothetical protein
MLQEDKSYYSILAPPFFEIRFRNIAAYSFVGGFFVHRFVRITH